MQYLIYRGYSPHMSIVKTLTDIKTVFKVNLDEAKHIHKKMSNFEALWVEEYQLKALVELKWGVEARSEGSIANDEKLNELRHENNQKLLAASTWYDSLTPQEQEYVEVIVKNRHIGPAMG